jgi:hypothetical protein
MSRVPLFCLEKPKALVREEIVLAMAIMADHNLKCKREEKEQSERDQVLPELDSYNDGCFDNSIVDFDYSDCYET